MIKKSLISILIIMSMIFGIIPTVFSASDVSIIKDFTFHGNSGELMYSGVSSEISYEAFDNGVKALRWYSPSSVATNGFADLDLPEMSGNKNYVFDMRVNVASLTGSSTIGFLDSKEADGSWTVNGFDLTADGKLTKGSKSTSISFNNWVRLSFVYTLSSGTIKVYVDGNEKISDFQFGSINASPVYWRFDIVSPSGSELDISIDWLRIYEGTTLLDDSYFDADMSHSIMDNAQKLEKALSGKTVFLTTNNSLCYNGNKEIITNNNEKLKYIDGTLMIPTSTVEKINGGSKITHNESSDTFTLGSQSAVITPTVQNGITYLPLTDAAQKLMGKKVSYDVRDMAIIADNAVDIRTSPEMYLDRHKAFYDYDLIYRYLLFDMPSGEKMLSDLMTRFPNKTHPRVYWTNDDAAYVLAKVQSDSTWKSEYNKNINVADGLLSTDFTSYYNAQDSQKQNAANVFQTNITSLASAYILTGNAKYAQKGIEMMKGFASWDSLSWKTSNLTIGYWAQGMGIGFDSFYNYMNSTSDGKNDIAYFKSRITELLYDDHIRSYEIGANAGPAWITYQDNFNGCIGGGMMCLLLAVCDEEDMADDSAYLMENVLRSLYIAAEVFFPDGGYYEGVTYGDMMLENFTNALDALFNSCGTDYGIGRVPGFSKAGEYFVYLNTPSGRLNFHDDGGIYYNRFVPEFMAYRYGETQTAILGRLSKELAKLGSVPNYGLKGLYYYDKAITDKNISFDVSGADLDKYFDNISTGTFRSNHTEEAPTYVGFHGGYTNIPHDMLDLGQFSFISDGVVWAADLGPDSYSLPSYFQKDGYKIYRKRTEGENCLVINPAVNPVSYHGQALGVSTELVMIDDNKPQGAMAAFDLTDAYSRDALSYVRGYYFGDNRRTLTVQDEVTLKAQSEAYWFMHTLADINIVSNNRAVLTKDGKSLTVEVYCNQEGFELKKMAAAPLSTSPQVTGQADNTGYSKLAVHHPSASGNLVIAVKLSPNSEYENAPLEYTPISDWSVPDGELTGEPQFTGIYADGELVKGFAANKESYKIVVPYGVTTPPTITAESDKGEISVKQANSLSEKSEITIKCAPYKDVVCTVEFEMSNDRPVNIKIQESNIVPANGEVKNVVVPQSVSVMNVPTDSTNIAYITDGKTETYYTMAEDSTWVELDLGFINEIAGVAVCLNEQANYKVMYSQDGTNFTQVYSGLSAGASGYELLPIWGRARYVRFVGEGNANGEELVGLAEFCAYYPLETKLIGSGIPRALIHKDGNYEFEIQNYGDYEVTYPDGGVQVVTPGDGSTASRESWVFVKYPMDANTGTYTFNLNLRIFGSVTGVKLHLYDKQNIAENRYIRGASLLENNLTWKTASTTNARKFNDLTFSIDTDTGYYSGKLDGVAFSDLGDNANKINDLSGGIGMIGIQITSASADWGTGVGFKSASVTHSANGTLGSGIPSETPTIKNGDFEATLVHFGYPDRIENCDDGRVMIANGDNVNVWKSDIQIKNNKVHVSKNSGILTFEFGVNAVGNYFNTGSFIEIYNKNNVKISTIQNLLYSTGEWNLSGNTPSSMNPIILKLNIDLETGTWTLYGGDYQFNGGSGTIDVSNGIGMVNFEVKVNAGGKVSVNSLKLTETSKVLSYANDHYTYIDGVPTIGSTYKSTVVVTDESKLSSKVSAQNGVLVMSGTDARLQFTRIMDADYEKRMYIEATVSADKTLTNANSTIQFNAMAGDGTYQISGANSQFGSNDFSAIGKEYVIGIVVDMKNNTYSLIQNGIITKTGTIAESDKDIKWVWLGFSDSTGAKLTIHNLKYMDIEPSNYDIATSTYFDIESVLLNGIAHYAGVTAWSENGVSFSAEKSGTVAMTKLDDCGGIVFTGSDSKENFARLSVAYDFDMANFADTYAKVRWEINLAGSDEQNIYVASRTSDGKFPVNRGGKASAGDHVVELEYNPSTCEYIYYFDGVKTGKYKLDEASLSNLFLEWYSDNASDVLTLKNVSVRKFTDSAEDKIDITLSDDYKTANAVVTIGKKFSTATGEVSFYIASYDGNELKAVNVYETTIDTGINNLEIALDNLNGGKEVRVFLWKENTLTPLV